MPIAFSVASIADAEDIARLHVTSWHEAYGGIIPADILANVDLQDRIERWRTYLGAAGHATFLARGDGAAAGFIRAGRLAEPLADGADGHIYALYELNQSQRLGIGRRLLGLAAADGIGRGGQAFSLGVLSPNLPAIAFYEAMGARFVKEDVYIWDGHSLDERIYIFENLGHLARFA